MYVYLHRPVARRGLGGAFWKKLSFWGPTWVSYLTPYGHCHYLAPAILYLPTVMLHHMYVINYVHYTI